MKPRLLDLFCCEGDASMGYYRAGFEVYGVDLFRHRGDDGKLRGYRRQRYPFAAVQGDALAIMRSLLAPTRDLLLEAGLPYVIENVPGAPMFNPLTLCGTEFGLRATDSDGLEVWLRRHRLFESNVFLMSAGGCNHPRDILCAGVYGNGSPSRDAARARAGGYTPPSQEVRAALMGIDWMSRNGLSQSIPPAYTEHIGRQLIDHLAEAAA